jgi:ribose 5-phosphate isomerase B
MKKIIIGSDHAGFKMKEHLRFFLKEAGYAVMDKGTYSEDSADYPDFAHPVAREVEENSDATGVLLCGSANGVAITANKHAGIRAALCWNTEVASLARLHNNANVICIPARFVNNAEAESMVSLFLTTEFEGGRHQRRVEKMSC